MTNAYQIPNPVGPRLPLVKSFSRLKRFTRGFACHSGRWPVEVAIDAPGGPGRSVLLLCDSDGGALCLVNANGKHRRARYSDSNLLPDGFIREALAELEQHDDLAA